MKLRNIFILFTLIALSSCFKDETTNAVGAISEISIIEGTIESVYDVDKEETLTIKPQITQTNAQKPVSYTWEVGEEVYSRSPELVYHAKELGSYNCRLIVENEDGKTFFPFKLNVNSPYEEGITVVSHDENGKSMLSFMLKQRTAGVEDFFILDDCFALNNPDEPFVSNAVDVLQCNGSLLIACKGDAAKGEPGTVYYLNEKTFVLENVMTAPEYDDFRPHKMLVPGSNAVGASYPILCENGKVYEFSANEGAVGEAVKFQSNYSLCSAIYDSGLGVYNNVYMWDKERGALAMQFNGYGPYYCSTTYHMQPDEDGNLSDNYFKGKKFVFMFMPRVVGKASPYGNQLVVLTQGPVFYDVCTLENGFWSYNEEDGKNYLGDYGGGKRAGMRCELTAETPFVATEFYNALYYAKGNKVKRANYTMADFLDKYTTVHATVGSAAAVITSMELSQDHLETYVAFYEPNESGLNGHVWVIETETGGILRKYDNVCYRPTKIIYKKK